MNTFSQWLQQHDFLLLICITLGGSAMLLSWGRGWSRGRLVVWSLLLLMAVAALLALRTPPASLSEPRGDSAAANAFDPTLAETSLTYTELTLSSTAAIHAFIQNSDKPTLLEIYSDYGLS